MSHKVLVSLILFGLSGYAIGSLPFGYLTAKLVAGKDIRKLGSGNIGATNVARVIGAKWGAFVLLLDCLKGYVPVWLLPSLVTDEPNAHLRVLCGMATIVGHMFPVWLGYRGGKGVATALGVVLCLAPMSSGAAFAVFAVSILVFRIVSLSSILAAVTFAGSQMAGMWPDAFSADQWSLGAFSLLVPLMIVFRHRTNISRLLRGEEPRFRAGAGDGDRDVNDQDDDRREPQ